MNIVLDTIKDSSYESSLDQVTIRRGFVATNLDMSLSYNVIRSAIGAGLPPPGSIHPTESAAKVVGYSIRMPSDSATTGAVIYQSTPNKSGNGQLNTFSYQRRTYLQNIETERNPADQGREIYTTYKRSTAAGVNDPNDAAVIAIGRVKYMRPIQSLSASGIFTARLSDTIINSVGKVNGDTFLGSRAGFWLIFAADDDTTDGGKTWQFNIQLMTLVNEDWSAWVIATDNSTKKPVVVTDVDSKFLKDAEYKVGSQIKNGMSKVGIYNTVKFADIFQFTNLP